MQTTAADFWRMVWEKKSHTIVMLGQVKENGEVSSANSSILIVLSNLSPY